MLLLVENYKDYCDWLLIDFVVFAKAEERLSNTIHSHTQHLRARMALLPYLGPTYTNTKHYG